MSDVRIRVAIRLLQESDRALNRAIRIASAVDASATDRATMARRARDYRIAVERVSRFRAVCGW